MFKIVLEDAKIMKNITDAIVNLIDEGPLEIKKEGLFLRAIDPSQIAMVTMEMPKETFTEYVIENEGAVIGINFANFSKILGRANTGEKLILSSEDNTLTIEFVGANKKRTFKVPLLDTKDLVTKELNIDPEAIVKINAKHIKESLKDAALISSYLALDVNNDQFKIDVTGDSSKLVVENQKDLEGINSIEMKNVDKARASFSLQYLESIMKACPDNNEVILSIKTEMPINIEYEIDTAKLKYFLAPRRED